MSARLTSLGRVRVLRRALRLEVHGRVVQADQGVTGEIEVIEALVAEELLGSLAQPGRDHQDGDLAGEGPERPSYAAQEPVDVAWAEDPLHLDDHGRVGAVRTLQVDGRVDPAVRRGLELGAGGGADLPAGGESVAKPGNGGFSHLILREHAVCCHGEHRE